MAITKVAQGSLSDSNGTGGSISLSGSFLKDDGIILIQFIDGQFSSPGSPTSSDGGTWSLLYSNSETTFGTTWLALWAHNVASTQSTITVTPSFFAVGSCSQAYVLRGTTSWLLDTAINNRSAGTSSTSGSSLTEVATASAAGKFVVTGLTSSLFNPQSSGDTISWSGLQNGGTTGITQISAGGGALTTAYSLNSVSGTSVTYGTVTYTAGSTSGSYLRTFGFSVGPASTVPVKPTNNAATNTSTGTSFTANWTSGGDGGSAIDEWSILFTSATAPSGYSTSTYTSMTTSPSATSFTITGATPGVTYTYTIEAHNSIGYSIASNAISVAMPNVPGIPSFTTTARGNVTGGVNLGWTTPANNGSAITGYDIQSIPSVVLTYTAGSGSSGGGTVTGSGTTTISFTTTSVTNLFGAWTSPGSQSYQFQVRAINNVGTSAWASSSAVIPPQYLTSATSETTTTTGTILSKVADHPRTIPPFIMTMVDIFNPRVTNVGRNPQESTPITDLSLGRQGVYSRNTPIESVSQYLSTTASKVRGAAPILANETLNTVGSVGRFVNSGRLNPLETILTQNAPLNSFSGIIRNPVTEVLNTIDSIADRDILQRAIAPEITTINDGIGAARTMARALTPETLVESAALSKGQILYRTPQEIQLLSDMTTKARAIVAPTEWLATPSSAPLIGAMTIGNYGIGGTTGYTLFYADMADLLRGRLIDLADNFFSFISTPNESPIVKNIGKTIFNVVNIIDSVNKSRFITSLSENFFTYISTPNQTAVQTLKVIVVDVAHGDFSAENIYGLFNASITPTIGFAKFLNETINITAREITGYNYFKILQTLTTNGSALVNRSYNRSGQDILSVISDSTFRNLVYQRAMSDIGSTLDATNRLVIGLRNAYDAILGLVDSVSKARTRILNVGDILPVFVDTPLRFVEQFAESLPIVRDVVIILRQRNLRLSFREWLPATLDIFSRFLSHGIYITQRVVTGEGNANLGPAEALPYSEDVGVTVTHGP